jgi:hypothetical protein
LAFRLRGAENLWTAHMTRRLASIHAALAAELADTVVLPGTINLLIAANRSLSRSPGVLGRRLEQRQIRARLVSPAYVHFLYANDRFAELATLLAATDAPTNTDARPICYAITLVIWLSKFVEVGDLDLQWIETLSLWVPITALAALLAGLLALRLRSAVRRMALVAAAAFSGMVIETSVILAYQGSRGALFGDLGLLLTAFMAGLAVGAWVVGRLHAWLISGHLRTRLTGGIVLLALAICGLSVAWMLDAGVSFGLAGAALLLCADGAAVAAALAFAASSSGRQQATVISPLYAADLIGGSLASVLASLAFIPVLGLWGAAYLGAALALLVVALL